MSRRWLLTVMQLTPVRNTPSSLLSPCPPIIGDWDWEMEEEWGCWIVRSTGEWGMEVCRWEEGEKVTIGRSEAGEMGTGVELSLLTTDTGADWWETEVLAAIGSRTERSLNEKRSEKSGAGHPLIDMIKLFHAVRYCYKWRQGQITTLQKGSEQLELTHWRLWTKRIMRNIEHILHCVSVQIEAWLRSRFKGEHQG